MLPHIASVHSSSKQEQNISWEICRNSKRLKEQLVKTTLTKEQITVNSESFEYAPFYIIALRDIVGSGVHLGNHDAGITGKLRKENCMNVVHLISYQN